MAKEKYLIIVNQDELVRVSPDRIVYIVSDGNYSTIILTDAEKRVFTINLGMFQQLIESQLKTDASQFVRVGKSLIINRNYIYYICPSRQQIILSDKDFQKRFELTASKEALKLLKTVIESTLNE
ncbi:MAG: LytTR family transcriptional regulator DNA-binding domain-containing protein [Tannerella sp.]|jgi:DNA-binding LytR/AlgR family response regulator|nr:LytTR family transcriptional regulator DNA-binding domain-containing protein [Tannerella sp.]